MAPSNPGLFVALQRFTDIFARTLTEVSVVFGQLAEAATDDGAVAAGAPAATARAERVQEPPAPRAPSVFGDNESSIQPENTGGLIEMAVPPAKVEEQTLQDILNSGAQLDPTGRPVDLFPVEHVGRELQVSPNRLYNLIEKGILTKYAHAGRSGMISRSEAFKVLQTSRTRTLEPLPEGMLTPIETAGRLGHSVSLVHRLIREGKIAPVEKASANRLAIPIASLKAYASAHNITLNERNKSEPAVIEEPEQEPTFDQRLSLQLGTLESEIVALEQHFNSLSRAHVAAHLTAWAGALRRIGDDLGEVVGADRKADVRKRVWSLTDQVRALADRHDVWVNALISEWTIEDWNLYIRAADVTKPDLSREELEVLAEGDLRALMLRPNLVTPPHVREAVQQARLVLDETNAVLVRTLRTFASKLSAGVIVSRAPDPAPSLPVPDPDSQVSPFVLSITAGKRFVIIGGQGARDAHIAEYIRQFRLTSCEWITHERSKVASLMRAKGRLTSRNFDLMIYLTGFTSHAANKLCEVAKAGKLPVVKVPNGYSVASLAGAIEDQFPVNTPAVGARNGTAKNGVHRRHA